MTGAGMSLTIVLPSRVFAELDGVTRIVAETAAGAFGILPHRLDCAATLVPGILGYSTGEDDIWLAVDQGVLVKTGTGVVVAVRAAHGGASLDVLRDSVTRDFLRIDAQERSVRDAMLRLESGFLRRTSGLPHE